MKIYFFGIFLLVFASISAQSCDITLSGNIIDFHNNKALKNARITILETNESTLSDDTGAFKLTEICPRAYTIEVSHPECEPLLLELELDKDMYVTWYLEHHVISLENIETIGNPKRVNMTQNEHHIHQDEIDKYSANSLGEVLKAQTGISALETGNSILKPMIHGMHSSRIIMMNRGVRQEDMEWGVEHAPNIDLNGFDDIRIVKGASALRYGGDAIGGVIITETPRLPKYDTLLGKVLLTTVLNGKGGNANLHILKGFESDFAFQLQGSYNRVGDRKAPDYYLTNSGNEQRAFSTQLKYGDFLQNLSIDYSFFETQLGILKASHLGNLNDLAEAINTDEPFTKEEFTYDINKPYQKVKHHLAKLKAEKRFRNFGILDLQYAFQLNNREEYDVRNGEVTNVPSMDVELRTHTFETHMKLDKLEEFSLETGADYAYQDNYSNPATQVKRLIPDYSKHKAGAYASLLFAPNSSWKLSSGIRYDYTRIDTKKYYYKRYWEEMNYETLFNQNIIGDYGNQWLTQFELDFHNISGTIGVSYRSNQAELNLNYAYANRAPNPAELFSEGLHHSAVSIELGDVRLEPEHAHKISINYNKDFEILDGINLNILGHFNAIDNYIYQVPEGAEYTIRGAFPVWKFQQIDAQIMGFDLDALVQINSHMAYSSQFSWTHGVDKTNDEPLLLMPPINWNQNLSYEWSIKHKPFIGLNTQYVAKQKRIPNYNFNLSVLDNGQWVDKTIDISSSPDAYFLWGMEAGLTFRLKDNPLLIQTRMTNILNVAYRNYLNRLRYFADDMGRQIQLQIIYKF